MNKFLKNLNKVEFVITDACTGSCKHCSQGDHYRSNNCIDSYVATDAIRKIASEYHLETVMTFGGEPLLCVDVVCDIMLVATELNIPKRQVITNGYFSSDIYEMKNTAKKLSECGVNDLLLSVDSFHQETIPVEIVKTFATYVKEYAVPTRIQPAWLISSEDNNHYNVVTKKILDIFLDMDIPVGDGNVIFPEGNALKYLSEYFFFDTPKNPYIENPFDVRCISFSANGDVLDGNIYQKSIIDIINNYAP